MVLKNMRSPIAMSRSTAQKVIVGIKKKQIPFFLPKDGNTYPVTTRKNIKLCHLGLVNSLLSSSVLGFTSSYWKRGRYIYKKNQKQSKTKKHEWGSVPKLHSRCFQSIGKTGKREHSTVRSEDSVSSNHVINLETKFLRIIKPDWKLQHASVALLPSEQAAA